MYLPCPKAAMALGVKVEPVSVARGHGEGEGRLLPLYHGPPSSFTSGHSSFLYTLQLPTPWQPSNASAPSHLWGFTHAVFSAKNTTLSVHSTQLLSSDIFLILQILSLAAPSSRKSSLSGPSARCLSCVHRGALSPPAIAFNTQAQMICLFVSPTGLQTP